MYKTFLPLFVESSSLPPILIIGGGKVATAKAETLISTGASIEVVARNVSDQLSLMCEAHGYSYTIAEYQSKYLADKRIVVAATNNPSLNKQIYQDCKAHNILINVVDSPELCDFIFPAIVKQGPLQIAISSSGIAPVLVRILKQKIEQIIPAQFGKLVQFLHNKKNELRNKLNIQSRRLFLEEVINGSIAEKVLEGCHQEAQDLFDQALAYYPNKKHSAFYLVSVAANDPDLITIKAIRLLGRADVVIYDHFISPLFLEKYVRRDAHKVNVGKVRYINHKQQHEINSLIMQYLRVGHIVVRLTIGCCMNQGYNDPEHLDKIPTSYRPKNSDLIQ